jgi:hypothetical protein
MQLLRNLNLLLRLLLEIALVASASYIGWHVGINSFAQWALALGLPILIIVVWSIYLAPISPRRLAKLPRVITELCLFTVAVIGLVISKQPVAAMWLAIAVATNEILLLLWEE